MNEVKRRLSAILSADVAGYSRLMGGDERATVDTLNAYRAVFRDHVAAHDGRVVDTAGDSVLAVFDSVVEAVHCAVEVQAVIGDRNDALSEERRMLFRIGINLGDVIEQADGSIYGDGVNIAARLESLATPGGICLSGAAHDFVDGKVDVGLAFMGEHEVKNIARPVRAYRVTDSSDDASAGPTKLSSSDLPDRPSIAVLPFANMSGNPDDAYFADGITEDIITEVSRFQELIVIARNSVFTYKDKAVKVQDVGRELNVRYVLEGSVRKGGDRVRVTAQLVEAETGHHIWAERYDRRLEDVFAVQDELTGKIVASLAGQVEGRERRRARVDDNTHNLRAYELALRGRELWNRFTPDDNLEARRLYERAIALDPEFARAYAGLAWTYMMAYDERWTDDPEGSLDLALEHANKGVEVNRMSHTNRLALGQVYFYKGLVQKGIEACERAIELNPNDPDGYVFAATGYCRDGQPEKALDMLDQAMALNPNPTQWHRGIYIFAYFVARRYEEAVAVMAELDSPRTMFYRWAAAAYAQLGHDTEARAMADKYLEYYPNFSLDAHVERMPFSRPEERDHYAEALRRAGLG